MKKPKRIELNCYQCGGILSIPIYSDDRFYPIQGCKNCNRLRIVQPDTSEYSIVAVKIVDEFTEQQVALMRATQPSIN